MIPAGQFIQQINRHACFFMTLNGTCKKTGGSCVQWNTMDDCDDKLCALFGLLDTTELDIRKAISSEISDFEDAVMVETAMRSDMDGIVTRNTKDYKKSPLSVYSPLEFVKLLTEETTSDCED